MLANNLYQGFVYAVGKTSLFWEWKYFPKTWKNDQHFFFKVIFTSILYAVKFNLGILYSLVNFSIWKFSAIFTKMYFLHVVNLTFFANMIKLIHIYLLKLLSERTICLVTFWTELYLCWIIRRNCSTSCGQATKNSYNIMCPPYKKLWIHAILSLGNIDVFLVHEDSNLFVLLLWFHCFQEKKCVREGGLE